MKYLKILNFSCLLDLWIYVEWGKLECAPIEWEGYDSLPYNIMAIYIALVIGLIIMAVFRVQCRRPYHLLLLSILNIVLMMIGFLFTLSSVLLKIYIIVVGQRNLHYASQLGKLPLPTNCLAQNPILITLGYSIACGGSSTVAIIWLIRIQVGNIEEQLST